jgi:uncharacterized protein YeaO (DUF488 family)
MPVQVKRAYEDAASSDGRRFLVDGIWPRGVTRDELQIEAWLKGLAPSTSLRKWFGHDPAKWGEFKRRYGTELDKGADGMDTLSAALTEGGMVTLVYGARDVDHNNAVALKEYLEQHTVR